MTVSRSGTVRQVRPIPAPRHFPRLGAGQCLGLERCPCAEASAGSQHRAVRVGNANHGEIGPVGTTAPRHRMPVRQAAAIWTLVFLIGLTGGELLRQQTLDAPALAVARSRTEPTAAIPAPAFGAAVPSATSTTTTTTTPRTTTTTIGCDSSPCSDHLGQQESCTEDGRRAGHGKDRKERGHGKDGKSGAR